MNNEFYIFPNYPLIRVINFIPGDIVVDSPGNIYLIEDNMEPTLILESILLKNYTIKGLKEHSYKKWFVTTTNYNLNVYFNNKEN